MMGCSPKCTRLEHQRQIHITAATSACACGTRTCCACLRARGGGEATGTYVFDESPRTNETTCSISIPATL
jgi:hypothetical protein